MIQFLFERFSKPNWYPVRAESTAVKMADLAFSTPVYAPLQADHIRLLVIKPGRAHWKLFCEVIHVSLGDEVSYEALSYAWGDPTPTHAITLQTGDRVTQIGVTKNLWDALRQFRDIDKSVTLWIDALCLYLDRHRMNYRGNLRLGPLFSVGFHFCDMVASRGPFLALLYSRLISTFSINKFAVAVA